MPNPEARGTVVELAGPAEAARRKFATLGLSARASVITGSFFDVLPADADAYVLSNVIHDWPDEQAITILRRSAEAAGTSGAVLVFEGVLDAGDEVATATDSTFSCWCAVAADSGRCQSWKSLQRRPAWN
jgi:hypothetical protein